MPNTNGLKGIEAAVAAGVVAGDAGKALEVISVVSGEQKARIQDMVGRGMCKVSLLDSGLVLDLIVTLHAGDDWARVRIVNHHTDVVLIEKNGAVLLEKPVNNTLFTGYTREYVPVLLKAPGHRQGGIVHAVLGAFDGTRCAAALAE